MGAKAYEELVIRERERGLLESLLELLEWDESTYMPRGGGEIRGDQKAYLAAKLFDQITDPKLGDLLVALESSDVMKDPVRGGNVRWVRRQHDRYVKIPKALVEEVARLSTTSVDAWTEARKQSQFRLFAPFLKRMVELRRETAKAVGFQGMAYDALLDYYEPGATTKQVSEVFSALRPELSALVRKVKGAKRQPKNEILTRHYPVEGQRKLSELAMTTLGFDRERGRLDLTTHPFCRSLGPGDVRLTTRYDPHYVGDGLFSTIHEAGHGMYEQGLNTEQLRLAGGRACSMGVHESQSRLWENQVGRSAAFWDFYYGPTQEIFPEVLKDVSREDFVFAVNSVEPSFIRTESDEVTYNLHIILRFEMEQGLLSGDIGIDDVPHAWNTKFEELFGIVPPNDAQGCLQDIHWSTGDLGYFPTYTLGNLYAAQFMEKAQADLGDLGEHFRRGQFTPLKQWLAKNIYAVGATSLPDELCRRVTGKPLSPAPLLAYLKAKVSHFYGV